MFRFRWDHIEAKLIDQRFLRRDAYNAHNPSSSYQVWEYIIEFTDTDGNQVRLPVKEKTFKVDLPEIGGTVPVLVNRRRTKAAFDLDDPRIDAVGRLKRREKAARERGKKRFDEKLGR